MNISMFGDGFCVSIKSIHKINSTRKIITLLINYVFFNSLSQKYNEHKLKPYAEWMKKNKIKMEIIIYSFLLLILGLGHGLGPKESLLGDAQELDWTSISETGERDWRDGGREGTAAMGWEDDDIT